MAEREGFEPSMAHLAEEESFVPLPPLVRIKTPSLPMTVCVSGARGGARQDWRAIAQDANGIRLEQHGTDTKPSFVLTGDYARFGAEMYRERFG
jgi:rubredoxin-NAD+ reductase